MKMDWSIFLGRVLPLYLLLAIPNLALIFPGQFVIPFFVNWAWLFILLRIFKPFA